MAAAKKAAAAVAKPVEAEEPEICPECFPNGWGAPMPEDGYAAGCNHGQWTHPGRVPADDGTATVLDVEDAGEPEDEGDEGVVKF